MKTLLAIWNSERWPNWVCFPLVVVLGIFCWLSFFGALGVLP